MGCSQEQIFTYLPFTPGKIEIRLCRVVHRSADEVHCSLEHFDVGYWHIPVRYTALSYTWGESTSTRPILVNGRAFNVRQNLWDYLAQGHMPDHGLIWIDQLCINQVDVQERNAQVSMMAEIYSHAIEVFIWFGSAGCHTTEALNFVERRLVSTSLPYGKPKHEELDGLIDIFARPYWTRLWIVQELVFARSIVWCCGSAHTEFPRVNHEYMGRVFKPFAAGSNAAADSRLGRAVAAREFFMKSYIYSRVLESDERHLDVALWGFKDQKCSDPRDKVFGLQGIVPQFTQVQVDYTKTSDEVFYLTMRSIAQVFAAVKPSCMTCEVFRMLKRDLRVSTSFLEYMEEDLGLLSASTESDQREAWECKAAHFNSSVLDVYDCKPGETEMEKRWDRVMMALPWGSKHTEE